MMTVPRELSRICRFCLCQDEKNLLLIEKTLSASLTIEDLERFTGIPIHLEDALNCAICLECLTSLNQSADFRCVCISNDTAFRQLCSAVGSSTSETSANLTKGADPLEVKIEVLEHTIVKTEPCDEVTLDHSVEGNDLNVTASQDVAKEEDGSHLANVFSGGGDGAGSSENDNSEHHNSAPQKLVSPKRTRSGRPTTKPKKLRGDDDNGHQKVGPKKRTRMRRPSNKVKKTRGGDDSGGDGQHKPAQKKRTRRGRTSIKVEKSLGNDGGNENGNNEVLADDNQKPKTPKKRIRNRRVKPRTIGENPSTEGGITPRVLCSICGKLVTNLSFHMMHHQETDTRYPCPYCSVQLKHKTYLTEHIRSIHLKLTVKTCEVCGKAFTTKKQLKSHMNTVHYTGEPLECNFCSKMFKNPNNLKSHLYLIHSGKLYTCGVCGMIFKSSTLLNKHKRVHSDDRPFPCGKCPKRFKSHYARTTHERTHSGILFRCTICDRSYRYKTFLNAHMRKAHGDANPQNETEKAVEGLNDETMTTSNSPTLC